MTKKRILVLGGTGMLGHTLFSQISLKPQFDVYATVRSLEGLSRWFSPELLEKMLPNVDAENFDSITRSFAKIQPDIVVNCIGIIKQLPIAKDHLVSITINSLLPHRIAQLCQISGVRMIHISTDCVFDGESGNYTEEHNSNAVDLYGKSKFLGEVNYPHSVTLRTSIIGHELRSELSLIDWFLAQREKVRGFTRAIYTGFPTVEMARIISEYVIPNEELNGLYQASSDPISKYELLRLVSDRYGKAIEIEPYDGFNLDRSLNSSRFRNATGYVPPSWPELVDKMYEHYKSFNYYN